MPSPLTRLLSLFPGYRPGPTAPAVVTETPAQRAARVVADTQAALERSRRRAAPSTDERVPSNYHGGVAGKVFFLPYQDSTTRDTPEIRAAMRLMRRDPYVRAAFEPQILHVASEDIQVQPSEEGNALAEEQARFCRANIEDHLAGGLVALVRAICAPLGSDGHSLSEKVWEVAKRGRDEGKVVIAAVKARDTDAATGVVRLEGDRFGNVTGATALREPGQPVYPITDFLFARYMPVFDEPLGEAIFRPSYGAYWMRDTVRKLRAIHTEKKMAGMLMGTYASDDDKGPLEAALARAKSATWISVPEGTRVEAINLSTASEPDYKSFDESLRDEIVTGIAFATLQILMGSAPGDIRGDSEVQKAMSDLGPWYLMSIVMDVVNTQLFPDIVDYNYPFPAAGGYPKLTFGAVSNAEIKEKQEVVRAAMDMGLVPSKKEHAKAWSVQLADPNDPDDAMTPPGQGGLMGGMGGFGQPAAPMGGGFAFAEGQWEAFGWSAAKSRTGNVKAVGTAEDAGQTLYGKQAQAAIARQGRTDRGEPHPEAPQDRARRLAQEREPVRQEARQALTRAIAEPAAVRPEHVPDLAAKLKTLTRDELRQFARAVAARTGGLKQEVVDRIAAHVRAKAESGGMSPNGVDKSPTGDNTTGVGSQPAAPKPGAKPMTESQQRAAAYYRKKYPSLTESEANGIAGTIPEGDTDAADRALRDARAAHMSRAVHLPTVAPLTVGTDRQKEVAATVRDRAMSRIRAELERVEEAYAARPDRLEQAKRPLASAAAKLAAVQDAGWWMDRQHNVNDFPGMDAGTLDHLLAKAKKGGAA